MKKVKIFMSVLMVALFFAACDKDKDQPVPTLTLDPAAVEVTVEKTATVNVKNGTAPFTLKVGDDKLVSATVKESAITVTGLQKGETNVTVTDKNGVTGKFTVKVAEKKEEGQK